MEYLYLGCLLVSIGLLVMLMLLDVRSSISQYMTIIIVSIACIGYYFMSISRTLEEALFSQIIAYVGCIFLPVVYFFVVLEICHFELRRYVKVILVMVQFCLYGFVCTIGRNDLFYKSAIMHMDNGVVKLEKIYGPLHTVAISSMVLYLLLAMVVVAFAHIKRQSVDRKSTVIMLVFMIIAILVYAAERIFSIKYNIIPLTFDILMFAAFIPIYDSDIFTVHENKTIINERLGNIGFLSFNRKRIYKGCNPYMEKVFPELLDYRLGQVIENNSQDLQGLIDKIDRVEEAYKNRAKNEHIHLSIRSYMVNGRYYDGMIHILTNPFGKLKGYTIELQDNTEHYKALELRERYNEELAHEVDNKTRRIKSIQEKIILGMAQMVESRDNSTGGHIKRTSDVVRIFAAKLVDSDLGLDERFLDLVIRSAPMHDLGKIGVDDAVLRKNGPFETPEEFNQMKKHSTIGFYMVREILSGVENPDFVRVAENVSHYHHEKVNGTGYPAGLKGDEIPIEARIMALADVFDALVSKRCYKEAFSYEKAYEIIKEDSGTHFDKQLAEVFLSCKEELEEYYNSCEK